MVRFWVVTLAVLAACASPSTAAPASADLSGSMSFVQANLAGGYADGARAHGVDDVVLALVDRVGRLPQPPVAVFLNEVCESHAAHVAARLGTRWRAFFVASWPGHSDCYPAPGTAAGRFGNAVLVHDDAAAPLVLPSCNDGGADVARCIPNWAPPAEQRRGACAVTVDDLVLCSVHIDPPEWQWHDEQLRVILRLAARLAGEHAATVVGGDLNAGGRAVRRAVTAANRDGFMELTASPRLETFPAGHANRDLDHIIVISRTSARAGGAHVIDLGHCRSTYRPDRRCSDHLGVVASMSLG